MSVEEQLTVGVRQARDRLIFELEGELDMASSPLLIEALADADDLDGPSTVVLDLRRVSFVDSTGLKAIFAARNTVTGQGRRFAVTEGSAQVQRLLSLTRLNEHLQTIDSPDAVLA